MQKIVIFIIVGVIAVTIKAQNPYFNGDKPGSCPPDQPVQICSRSCHSDADCLADGKCCPTSCGGNVCTIPVTMKQALTEKAGSCPKVPTGRWVCSPTCTTDTDCRGTTKCCKNRCGALACQKPDFDAPEFVEVPLQPLPENIPNLNPRNPFLFPAN